MKNLMKVSILICGMGVQVAMAQPGSHRPQCKLDSLNLISEEAEPEVQDVMFSIEEQTEFRKKLQKKTILKTDLNKLTPIGEEEEMY